MSYKTWLEISKSNLLHNIREITKHLNSKTRFMAVIKSNAYGHGVGKIASILATNQKAIKHELWFGVDSIWEARNLVREIAKLRIKKLRIPILVLGYTPREELKNIPNNVRLTIGSLEALKEAAQSGKSLKIHLKIETGTMRQGIRVTDLTHAIRILKNSRNLKLEGISSHFAEAEIQPTTSFTRQQIKIFYDASNFLSQQGYKDLIRHIACSAAASHLPEGQFDMVRTGINLYGLQSINRHREAECRGDRDFTPNGLPRPALFAKSAGLAMTERMLNLKPVLTWKTIVAQIKAVKKGETIGYGRSVKMPYNGQIVVLPIGYWDGYDRGLSGTNRHREADGRGDFLAFPPGELPRPALAGLAMTGGGEVLIGGKRCRIIGRICMNMCMALLPKNLRAEPEDEVVLIGEQGNAEVTADELAQKIGTINYEVVTRINPLIRRVISH